MLRGETMDRRLGVGVVGLGWMGRVHTSAYRRVPDHYPELGLTPRLVAAADPSPARRAPPQRLGFPRTTDDRRPGGGGPAPGAVSGPPPDALPPATSPAPP